MLFGWVGLRRRREPPYLDVAIEVDFENGSFADSNPWQRATGHVPGQTDPVCRLSFGVSPLHESHLRRRSVGRGAVSSTKQAAAAARRQGLQASEIKIIL